MSDLTDDPRGAMVSGAADMIGSRGLNATSVRELAKHAGAPLGSTYHYFPGGKSQLLTEAVRWADGQTARTLAAAMAAGPAAGLARVLDIWRNTLLRNDFESGCPVLAASVENLPDGESAPREAAVFAYSNWTSILAAALREHGVPRGNAIDTATLIIAAVEGAVAMCRAERSLQPLDTVGAQLRQVLANLG